MTWNRRARILSHHAIHGNVKYSLVVGPITLLILHGTAPTDTSRSTPDGSAYHRYSCT